MANGLFWSTFTAFFLLLANSQTTSAQNYRMCDNNRTGTFADPSDCRYFIFCLNGQPKRYQCHNQQIYSTKTKTCVSANEAIGECTSVFKRTSKSSISFNRLNVLYFHLQPQQNICCFFWKCCSYATHHLYSFSKQYTLLLSFTSATIGRLIRGSERMLGGS